MARKRAASRVTADLTAVVISIRDETPIVLTVDVPGDDRPALPAGPFQPDHRTLQAGLRAWVEAQTGYTLGYVEQLYTFGDRPGGAEQPEPARTLSVAYLALVPSVEDGRPHAGRWRDWYDFLSWEDARAGAPGALGDLRKRLEAWAYKPRGRLRQDRVERVNLTFGGAHTVWDEERALERYELLYEAGLVAEAHADRGAAPPRAVADLAGRPMLADHRRMLATAMSRLRAKIKYRPVLFELMPAEFTLLQLQRTCEALSGIALHKQNFRRLVLQQGLVEETGNVASQTGGRPAKLMRFRREVAAERPSPGLRVRATRRGGYP